MSNFNEETVLSVHHWTDRLFSFKTTRNPAFRYRNGQFTMIGLKVEGRPLLRAYSMASANHDDHLEFFSIKVPNGPLTSRLQHLKEGDPIVVGMKPTGTLIQDNLLPGKNLPGPRIETADEIMTVATGSPMERSIAEGYARLIQWMEADYGWDRWKAYDLLTQVGRISVGYYGIGTVATKVPKRYLR